MININCDYLIENIDFANYQNKVNEIAKSIEEQTGAGNDFLGWLNYPNEYDKDEFERIKQAAKRIREQYDVFVVCGIGGSYLGARAAIEALNGLKNTKKPEIIFMGQTFSSNYVHDILEYLKDKNFAINVISKSGTTTETAISFRLLRELLEQKVGKENAKKAIFATTDKEKGALKQLSTIEGYETFTLPSNIGGRYSVLTPVGLLPIAVAGIDIDEMMKGAAVAMNDFKNSSLDHNPSYKYAVIRDYFYHHNKDVEMFVTYEPSLVQLGEWFKQLFGESEGKEGKGLLPTSATFSTDLHSLGQFIQEGHKILFETILSIKKPNDNVLIPHDETNLDELNYLENKSLDCVNKQAMLGTIKAHVENGNVPNVVIEIDQLNAKSLGYLFYFFMKTCAMSAYLLNVNPFNQPGVEVYKKNMFHLLGKKGY